MRMVTSHQFNVSKDPLSLFTRAHWDTCGGAGQMYHLQEEHYENQEYLGPKRMQQFMGYVQRYTGNLTWVRPATEESPDGEGVQLFNDQNVTISMIPVDVKGDTAATGTVLAYACKLSDAPGKFFPDKAAALGIPSGPAYKFLAEGYSVITEQGDLVLPSQVQTEGRKGPTFLVIDCPTKSYSDALTSNHNLQPKYYAKHEHKVALVVHITPLDVLQGEKYCQWMAGFGSDTQHLFLHSTMCPGEIGYTPSIKIYMALHLLNPRVYLFPCPPASNVLDKSTLRISKQLSEDSLILGRTFLKYNLKLETGVDTEGCLLDLEEQLKAELKSTMGNANAYRKILAHRELVCEEKSVDIKATLPALMKTGHSVKPADADDAVVTILGSSAAFPTKHRNCSGILVQTLQDGNFLLDCSEGTLQQLYRCFGKEEAGNILRNMNVIFISHAHPDHHMGLVSVLNQIHALTGDNASHRTKLVLGGHQALQRNNVCDKLQLRIMDPSRLTRTPYPCSDAVTMEMVPVKHIRNSFGCVLRKKGKWSIVYSGDTVPVRSLVEAGRNATLLIHEATFEDSMVDEARRRNHCTYTDAMRVASAMKAQFTITTHFSTRGWWMPMLRRNMVRGMTPAVDFMTVRLSDLPDLHLDAPSSCAALHSIAHILADT